MDSLTRPNGGSQFPAKDARRHNAVRRCGHSLIANTNPLPSPTSAPFPFVQLQKPPVSNCILPGSNDGPLYETENSGILSP
ncbi:unnamed protein product [Schistocephalus solidus]|uniref:Uncharacterized protein n=1 Tax=Schistocephalus solidus TaxID=70667 RepID=A0A183SHK0_SCHSO|nr:unnamed protein product [Schistocephalus solidus]